VVIARGLKAFLEVGTALSHIRDLKLHRAGHESFEAYCRDRWAITRGRAYQLIDAASVVQDLSTTVRRRGGGGRTARAQSAPRERGADPSTYPATSRTTAGSLGAGRGHGA
jgi:hypothetical protein